MRLVPPHKARNCSWPLARGLAWSTTSTRAEKNPASAVTFDAETTKASTVEGITNVMVCVKLACVKLAHVKLAACVEPSSINTASSVVVTRSLNRSGLVACDPPIAIAPFGMCFPGVF